MPFTPSSIITTVQESLSKHIIEKGVPTGLGSPRVTKTQWEQWAYQYPVYRREERYRIMTDPFYWVPQLPKNLLNLFLPDVDWEIVKLYGILGFLALILVLSLRSD